MYVLYAHNICNLKTHTYIMSCYPQSHHRETLEQHAQKNYTTLNNLHKGREII